MGNEEQESIANFGAQESSGERDAHETADFQSSYNTESMTDEWCSERLGERSFTKRRILKSFQHYEICLHTNTYL